MFYAKLSSPTKCSCLLPSSSLGLSILHPFYPLGIKNWSLTKLCRLVKGQEVSFSLFISMCVFLCWWHLSSWPHPPSGVENLTSVVAKLCIVKEQGHPVTGTRGVFVQIADFQLSWQSPGSPGTVVMHPGMSWRHRMRGLFCTGGIAAVALLWCYWEMDSNRAFLCADLWAGVCGDGKKHSRERPRSIFWIYGGLVQMGKPLNTGCTWAWWPRRSIPLWFCVGKQVLLPCCINTRRIKVQKSDPGLK